MVNIHMFRGLAIAAGLAAVVLFGLVGIALFYSGNFEAFFVVVLLGGSTSAFLLRGTKLSGRPSVAVPDPFARDAFSTDTVNIAHVRVAGVGGLALVLVSALVVLQYPLLAAAVTAGLVGGILGGGSLILYRKHRLRS
jgi:hypothetical protein